MSTTTSPHGGRNSTPRTLDKRGEGSLCSVVRQRLRRLAVHAVGRPRRRARRAGHPPRDRGVPRRRHQDAQGRLAREATDRLRRPQASREADRLAVEVHRRRQDRRRALRPRARRDRRGAVRVPARRPLKPAVRGQALALAQRPRRARRSRSWRARTSRRRSSSSRRRSRRQTPSCTTLRSRPTGPRADRRRSQGQRRRGRCRRARRHALGEPRQRSTTTTSSTRSSRSRSRTRIWSTLTARSGPTATLARTPTPACSRQGSQRIHELRLRGSPATVAYR